MGLSVSYAKPKDLENGVGFGVTLTRYLIPELETYYNQLQEFSGITIVFECATIVASEMESYIPRIRVRF